MKLLSFTLLVFVSCLSVAQVQELDRQRLEAEMFELDKLGSFYFVNENILTKTDKDLTVICTYDNFSWGAISLVDVSDPLRVLVFYKDFNRLIYLDKNFAELRDPVLLDDVEFYNVDVLASSQQGGFWIYDNQSVQAINLTQNLNVNQKGTNLYALTEGAKMINMQISADFIVIETEFHEIIVLDKFANYYTKIDNLSGAPICLDNNILYTLDGSLMSSLNLNTNIKSIIDIPISDIKDFEVSGSRIFILSENSLITFQIL